MSAGCTRTSRHGPRTRESRSHRGSAWTEVEVLNGAFHFEQALAKVVREPDEVAVDVVDRVVDLEGGLTGQVAGTIFIDEALFHGGASYWVAAARSKDMARIRAESSEVSRSQPKSGQSLPGEVRAQMA